MNNQAAVAPQERQSQPVIKQYMARYKENIERIMPNNVDFAKLEGGIMTECRRNPDLLKADPKSLLDVVMTCARLGLQPGPLGECYITTYNAKEKGLQAEFALGYKGMITLARRSGEIQSVQSFVVRENDDFAVTLGTTPGIHHIPRMDGAPMVATYAVATMRDGSSMFEVCDEADIKKARGHAKTKYIWDAHPERMARKTSIRRLFSELPVSIETHEIFRQANIADDHGGNVYDSDFNVVKDAPPPPPQTRTEQIKQDLEGLPEPGPEPEPLPIDVEAEPVSEPEPEPESDVSPDGEMKVGSWVKAIQRCRTMKTLSKTLRDGKAALNDPQSHQALDDAADHRSAELAG